MKKVYWNQMEGNCCPQITASYWALYQAVFQQLETYISALGGYVETTPAWLVFNRAKYNLS